MLWLPRLAKALLPHLAPQQGARGKGTGSIEALWTVASLIDSVCVEPTQKRMFSYATLPKRTTQCGAMACTSSYTPMEYEVPSSE